MNLKRARPEIQKSRLENEVILAVIILYVLLSAVLLAIHQMQPDEAPTKTSSTSPAHGDFSAATKRRVAAAIAEPMTLPQARQALARAGFEEIRDIRAGGSGFQAIAIRDGKPWQVDIDAATGQILRTPLAAR